MATTVTYRTIIHNAIQGFNDIQNSLNSIGAKYGANMTSTVPVVTNTDSASILSVSEILSSDAITRAASISSSATTNTSPSATISGQLKVNDINVSSPATSSVYVTLSGVGNSWKVTPSAKANQTGYIGTTGVVTGTPATGTTGVVGNGNKVYIPTTNLVSGSGTASITLNKNTPAVNQAPAMVYDSTTDTGTNYVTVLSTGSGRVSPASTGYITSTSAVTSNVGNDKKYIKAATASDLTLKVTTSGALSLNVKDKYNLANATINVPDANYAETTTDYSIPSVTFNPATTGFTKSASSTPWYITFPKNVTKGSVRGLFHVQSAGWMKTGDTKSNSLEINPTAPDISPIYLPSATIRNGFTTNSGMVSENTANYITSYNSDDECVDIVFNS